MGIHNEQCLFKVITTTDRAGQRHTAFVAAHAHRARKLDDTIATRGSAEMDGVASATMYERASIGDDGKASWVPNCLALDRNLLFVISVQLQVIAAMSTVASEYS